MVVTAAAVVRNTLNPKTLPPRVQAELPGVPRRAPTLGREAARSPLHNRNPHLGKLLEPNNPENLLRPLGQGSPREACRLSASKDLFLKAQKSRLPKISPR